MGTAVLEKRGQDWKIVHWHSSAPRRAPTPAASPTRIKITLNGLRRVRVGPKAFEI
ncbi:MAG: nuclear transport factor 2 family protein [Pyrinomonadaceae bacterium]